MMKPQIITETKEYYDMDDINNWMIENFKMSKDEEVDGISVWGWMCDTGEVHNDGIFGTNISWIEEGWLPTQVHVWFEKVFKEFSPTGENGDYDFYTSW